MLALDVSYISQVLESDQDSRVFEWKFVNPYIRLAGGEPTGSYEPCVKSVMPPLPNQGPSIVVPHDSSFLPSLHLFGPTSPSALVPLLLSLSSFRYFDSRPSLGTHTLYHKSPSLLVQRFLKRFTRKIPHPSIHHEQLPASRAPPQEGCCDAQQAEWRRTRF